MPFGIDVSRGGFVLPEGTFRELAFRDSQFPFAGSVERSFIGFSTGINVEVESGEMVKMRSKE